MPLCEVFLFRVSIHIPAIEYALPDFSHTLEELAAQGRLTTPVDTLRTFGFEQAWIAEGDAYSLGAMAVHRLLDRTGLDPASVGLILQAGATPGSHATDATLLGGFSYPVSRLQYDFGFTNARTLGISQAGCLGLMSAVGLARAMLLADRTLSRVLCVSVDVLPAGATREILYNVISDGACALLVEPGDGPNRIVVEHHVTKGYYWNCDEKRNEIVAAYFPTARSVIAATLDAASLGVGDIAWVVPHNVSLRSWQILLQLTGLDPARLFAANIAAKAHVIGGDNFINLRDLQAEGRLERGDRLLLFNFGFGASWAGMIIEH